MSNPTPDVPDHTVQVNQHVLGKIERELKSEHTNWSKIEQFMLAADLSVKNGYALVVPADYPGKSAMLVTLPAWVHLDAPGSTVRVTHA